MSAGPLGNFSALGGTLFGRRDIPVSPQGDTPPQMCFEGGGRNTISRRTCSLLILCTAPIRYRRSTRCASSMRWLWSRRRARGRPSRTASPHSRPGSPTSSVRTPPSSASWLRRGRLSRPVSRRLARQRNGASSRTLLATALPAAGGRPPIPAARSVTRRCFDDALRFTSTLKAKRPHTR